MAPDELDLFLCTSRATCGPNPTRTRCTRRSRSPVLHRRGTSPVPGTGTVYITSRTDQLLRVVLLQATEPWPDTPSSLCSTRPSDRSSTSSWTRGAFGALSLGATLLSGSTAFQEQIADMEPVVVKGAWVRRRRVRSGGACVSWTGLGSWACRCDACQADIRGLGTAGRGVRPGVSACSSGERRGGCGWAAAHSDLAGHPSLTLILTGVQETVRGAQSSKVASDQHHEASSRAMAVLAIADFLWRASKACPALMKPPVAQVATCAGRGGGLVPSTSHHRAGPVGLAVVPSGLDQQPPDVVVAGLGDRSLDRTSRGSRWAPAHDEPIVLPVNRCRRRSRLRGRTRSGRDPAQAAEATHDRGELAVGGHLPIAASSRSRRALVEQGS